ncbi:MAG: PQQ-binding-like beta-propeller repeat protein [Planctomycetota bacterium]|nr:PQQ-binding-like beta-propeller repeat protein [Planctomycetota bacterium]
MMTNARFGVAAVLFLLVGWTGLEFPTLRGEDWARFRGPRGNGSSTDAAVPTEWTDSQNLKWKLRLPGAGFSSPIVVGDRVFVTAYSGSRNRVKRHLVCVDRATGVAAWTRAIDGVGDGGDRGPSNHGQASHTPVSDGERVYVMFGSSGLVAFDMKGEQLWQQELGNERAARFGTASSPILHGDYVIVTAGAESESIRALDKTTGKEVWKTEAGSLSGTYSTPLIVTNSQGVDELLLSVTYELWSLNPSSGKLNWYAETEVDTAACPSLIAQDGIAYVIGGRRGGRAAVRIAGKGDVTDSGVVWSTGGGAYVPSPVLHKGHLYWVNDNGIASCIDAKTGDQVARKRLGGRFYASMALINDKLYAVNRSGKTHVLKATPEFEQIALNTLTDSSEFCGSPAVSNGQLFLRSDEFLYCIEAP